MSRELATSGTRGRVRSDRIANALLVFVHPVFAVRCGRGGGRTTSYLAVDHACPAAAGYNQTDHWNRAETVTIQDDATRARILKASRSEFAAMAFLLAQEVARR